MIKKSLLLILVALSLFSIDESFTLEKENELNKGDRLVYTIQLATFPKNKKYIGIKFLNNLDENIRLKSVLYPIGDFFTLRYNPSTKRELLFDEVYKLRDMGHESAFIVQTSLNKFYKAQKETISNLKFNDVKEEKQSSLKIYTTVQEQTIKTVKISPKTKKNTVIEKKLTKYEYTATLDAANKLTKNNQLIDSIEKYEILFKDRLTNKLVNKNLFYLYGKTNNWQKAKINIQNIKRKDKLLYAYGLGALENFNQNLENELKPELNEDLSGYVNLVLGVFKERQKEYKCAYAYYENAYMKNKFDIFIQFAYARAYELIGKNDFAQNIYLEISSIKSDNYANIKTQAYNRYLELKELARMKTKE
ncbi:MAG: hypothetical protein KAQ94_06925 [Arcobacteraceae bacterium]|nr:hypothetical protein [Arcobacteraceae bacterium]